MVRILNAKYKQADPPKVVRDNYTHLDSGQKEDFLVLLGKFDELFDGTLGDWKTEPVSLEIKEGANPFHGRPVPAPVIHRYTLRIEDDILVELGVLKWQGASEWASPTFIIVRKGNGTFRFRF